MSLEKEPAGAFNKAQRLIECIQGMLLPGKAQGPFRSWSEREAGFGLPESRLFDSYGFQTRA
jgi:hypothetical protein